MKKIIFTTFLVLARTTAIAEEAKISFSTGYNFSSGKYGQSEATEITYIPFVGKYEYGRWLAKLTIPWVKVEGSSGVTSDESKIIIKENINKHTRESGIGDVISSLSYTAYWSPEHQLVIDLLAKVKWATGSTSKGLSSGENDYSIAIDTYKTFSNTTLFSTLGYKFIGDPGGSNYDLNNVWFGTLGAAYKFDEKNSAGLFLDLREAAWEYNTNLREYTAYYSHKFNQKYKLQTYLSAGDTTSSVDYAAGMMLGVSWQ
jgi:outer membrane putative beta-barrel porin/alpha-amylase